MRLTVYGTTVGRYKSSHPVKSLKRREWSSFEFKLECIAGEAGNYMMDAYCDIVDFMQSVSPAALTAEDIESARTFLEGRQRLLFDSALTLPHMLLARMRRRKWAKMCFEIGRFLGRPSEDPLLEEILKKEAEGILVSVEECPRVVYGTTGLLWKCIHKDPSTMSMWNSPMDAIRSASSGADDRVFDIFCECFPDFPSTDDIINYRASMG